LTVPATAAIGGGWVGAWWQGRTSLRTQTQQHRHELALKRSEQTRETAARYVDQKRAAYSEFVCIGRRTAEAKSDHDLNLDMRARIPPDEWRDMLGTEVDFGGDMDRYRGSFEEMRRAAQELEFLAPTAVVAARSWVEGLEEHAATRTSDGDDDFEPFRAENDFLLLARKHLGLDPDPRLG
jgi:hypothetical protein